VAHTTPLQWKDDTVEHGVGVEGIGGGESIFLYESVKSGRKQPISLKVPVLPNVIINGWTGEFIPITPEYRGKTVFTQLRVLVNLKKKGDFKGGCIAINTWHWHLTNDQTFSIDNLGYMPGMQGVAGPAGGFGRLVRIAELESD